MGHDKDIPAVLNMPSGLDFLPALASGLDNIFGKDLQNGLILLPTRRAVRDLSDAFTLRAQAGGAAARILPPMRPLADIDPDEPPFEPGDLASRVWPAISGLERRFELSRLVRRYYEAVSGETLSPAIALTLTDPLLRIIDDVAMEGRGEIDLSGLDDISNKAAAHFQTAAEFYKIIQGFWPAHLSQMKRLDPMARRVALLDALTAQWTEQPPDHPVIIAGSTGTLPATARLMRCVMNLPKGMIVLPGLAVNMRPSAWEKVSEDHPQFSMKRLLQVLDLDFDSVANFIDAADLRLEMDAQLNSTGLRARRAVISESLVPVEATEEWLGRIKAIRDDFKTGDAFDLARENFALIEANDDEEEALAIAVIMREALEDPDKTATLVTPDPALARRVKSRLRRWGVRLDSSAGEPLEETPTGAFLAHILRLAGNPFNPVYLSGLMASPFANLGQAAGAARAQWLVLDKTKLRGVRKHPDILAAYAPIDNLHKALAPLLSPPNPASDSTPSSAPNSTSMSAPASYWAKALTQAAESLAAREEGGEMIHGAVTLWQGEAGETAASLLTQIIAIGDILGGFNAREFREFFAVLMRGQVVRPRFGTHPQLRILGPLEARMLSSDITILGGLNEGLWPAAPTHDPFLSRAMRQSLGLTLPERRYGLSAHDFEGLAMGPNVILTRSKRSDGTPMVASRWLWRLKTLFNGAYRDEAADNDKDLAARLLAPSTPYLDWARALDYVAPQEVTPAAPPNPKPPLDARWPLRDKDVVSVTKFKTWIRDPYAVYARHILGLEPLDDLDMPIGPREYGTALHEALESLLKAKLSRDAVKDADKLNKAFHEALRAQGFDELDFIKEDIRLDQLAEAVISDFHSRRDKGYVNVSGETKGRLNLPDLGLTIIGYPDRIDKGPNGYEIIDFKTGQPPGKKEVIVGFDPQLPLLAMMTERGAFKDVPPGAVDELSYKRLRGTSGGYETYSVIDRNAKSAFSAADHIAKTRETVAKLMAQARDIKAGYPSQIRRKWANAYGDYDLLARREEWSQLTGEGGDNG
jgi:ATP-dependent helicase/nuclease subunit B